ncbi:MAG TPA: alpha/beta fold hydrolase [Gemmatimonadales bacterium]|jgi:proline iminopeptidase|nr:alpha/beta fold hydrolase [Gemmatimonadales bacterium]
MPNPTTAVRHVNGVALYERRTGAGPPVVVLHGGPGAHHDYLLPGFDALARGRELIYYDQRGGGRSPVAREVPVGWRDQVADLEALRGLWGLERLTIAGYSWGGLLALLYAVTHPARVERLALISPAPAWRAAREEFERRFRARTLSPALQAARQALRQSGLRERDPAAHQQRLFELAVAGYFHDPAQARSLTPFRITERTQRAVWESLGDYDLRPALEQVRVPALVLHGDDDPIPLETAEAVARAIGAEFHVLRDCGHVPYVEAFDQFVKRLDGFLPRAAG